MASWMASSSSLGIDLLTCGHIHLGVRPEFRVLEREVNFSSDEVKPSLNDYFEIWADSELLRTQQKYNKRPSVAAEPNSL